MTQKENKYKNMVRSLYHGASIKSQIFRYTLLVFDVATILFFVLFTLYSDNGVILTVEYVIAALIFLDFSARLWIANNRISYLSQITSWIDILVLLSLLLPLILENVSFLRVIRALRLLRSYHILNDLRKHSQFFKKHEEIIQSVTNLGIFIFVITALVYVFQVNTNPNINSYIDALYFTVTALTTTGFGDITLLGNSGRLLSIIIMVVGVGLFLRLVQTIFRPAKVYYKCTDCGLTRHDPDAVHCKHCGKTLNIRTEGVY